MTSKSKQINLLKRQTSFHREERLVRLLPGDTIEMYGFFRNLTFVDESGGHVTMRDRTGNEKRVYTPLFLKHAKFQPNVKVSDRPS